MLDVSRNAIWKQIQSLEGLGLEVFAVHGKGYRLREPIELLDRDAIVSRLDAGVAKKIQDIELLHETDSTNTRLSSLPATRPGFASVCIAEHQSGGRGRLGREWQSPYASGLLLSMSWCFPETPPMIQSLSLAVGVGIRNALSKSGIAGVGLKWPNDLVCDAGKLGGILVELQGEAGGPAYVITGVGINYRLRDQTHDAMAQIQAADLCSLGGDDTPGRNDVCATLVNAMIDACAQFEQSGFERFLSDWRAADAYRDLPVSVSRGEKTVDGVARGIDNDGALLVEIDGEMRRYVSGEISLRVASA
jgi:BirA family biotin operon repressor/biotin-[acetyl-CoA-carboxylase] ligase